MRYANDVLFENESVASETTVSEAVEITHIYGFSVWASYSGTTLNGSIKLECSVDGENWEDIQGSSQSISGSGSSYIWNYSAQMYRYFRVSVTANDANAITVNCKFHAKGA